jgi:hypothetical protein
MANNNDLVFGERGDLLVEALLPALRDRTVDDDRMCRFEINLEPRLGQPLMRALMRAEAKLLLEDANAVGTPDYEERTDDQRRLDALLEIADVMASLTRRDSGAD